MTLSICVNASVSVSLSDGQWLVVSLCLTISDCLSYLRLTIIDSVKLSLSNSQSAQMPDHLVSRFVLKYL